MTKAVEEAKRKTAQARGDVAKLHAERAELHVRASELEDQKVANKTDATAFRRTCVALAEVRDEIERIELLVKDAERDLSAALDAESKALFQVDAAACAEQSRAALAAVEAFSVACGECLATYVQLKAAVVQAEQSIEQLSRRAPGVRVNFDTSARGQLDQARELFGLLPKFAVLNGLRDRGAVERVARAMREKLALNDLRPGARYPAEQQVFDLISGEYEMRAARANATADAG